MSFFPVSDLIRNEGQLTAIRHRAGPMLVLAGPGSGKTYVITHHILYLISECNILPQQILVITYTKAAAEEMRRRAILLDKRCAYVQFGTFHAIFYQILKISEPDKKLSVASDKERLGFVSDFLKGMEHANREKYAPKEQTRIKVDHAMEQEAEEILKEISLRKNNLSESGHTHNSKEPLFLKVWEAYESWLKEEGKLDFDDMVLHCYRLLKENALQREKWKKRFSHILMDEFQDINGLQYETVKLLTKTDNIFAVGDDDQSIYGFRGSDPLLMQQFIKEYAPKTVKLSFNYRCCPDVVKLAARSIGHNKKRLPKTMEAVKKTKGSVVIKGFTNTTECATFLKEQIEEFAKHNPGKTQAVLCRTNRESAAYQGVYGSKMPFWIRDIKAYLAFINEGNKREDFLAIMNKPQRYLSRTILEEGRIDFEKLAKRLTDKPWIGKRLLELKEKFIFAKKLDFYGQLHYIWHVLGYGEYAKEREEECESMFYKLLKEAAGCRDWEMLLEEQGMHHEEKEKSQAVFMTYHGAKGLEFDRVYLPGLNYGKVPHGRMLTAEAIEEERRMFYVAMTRAKEELFLLYENEEEKNKDSKMESLSPFLAELL